MTLVSEFGYFIFSTEKSSRVTYSISTGPKIDRINVMPLFSRLAEDLLNLEKVKMIYSTEHNEQALIMASILFIKTAIPFTVKFCDLL